MGTEGPRSGLSKDPRTHRATWPAGVPTSTEQQRGPSGVETGKPGRKTGKGQGFRWQSYYHRKTGGRGRTQVLAFRSCGTGGGVSWPSRGRSAGLGGGGRLCPSGTAHGRLVFSQKLGNSPHSDPSLDPADQWLVLHDLGPLSECGDHGEWPPFGAALPSAPRLVRLSRFAGRKTWTPIGNAWGFRRWPCRARPRDWALIALGWGLGAGSFKFPPGSRVQAGLGTSNTNPELQPDGSPRARRRTMSSRRALRVP